MAILGQQPNTMYSNFSIMQDQLPVVPSGTSLHRSMLLGLTKLIQMLSYLTSIWSSLLCSLLPWTLNCKRITREKNVKVVWSRSSSSRDHPPPGWASWRGSRVSWTWRHTVTTAPFQHTVITQVRVLVIRMNIFNKSFLGEALTPDLSISVDVCWVPGVQPADAIVGLHGVCESLHVLHLQGLHQALVAHHHFHKRHN